MRRRLTVLGLPLLVALLGGGLVLWRFSLATEEARREAEREERLAAASAVAPAQETAGTAAGAPAPAVEPAAVARLEPPAVEPRAVARLEPTLGGQVLRLADDSPVDGAIVEVLGAPGADGRPTLLCRTNTLPDGRFVLTASGLPATALRLWCSVPYLPAEPPPERHPGYGLGECVVRMLPLAPGDERRLDLTLRLDTGWVLAGTVFDSAGNPLTGGLVTTVEPHASGEIDPQGGFVIRDLPPGGPPLTVIATGEGVRASKLEVQPPADARIVRSDIRLEPAGMIYGTISWQGSAPRPLMAPVLTLLNPPEEALPGSPITRPAAVDAEGNFRIDGLGPGSWDLSCAWSTIDGNRQRTFVGYARGVTLGSGERRRQDFALPGTARLALAVAGPDGAPLAGRLVEVCHVLDPEDPRSPVLGEVYGTTAADGTCALADLAPGTKELRILDPAPPPQPGVPPQAPRRLATERVTLADGDNPVRVVAGGR
ncbi:MAG TPA: carboxypeptidase-like regulatory domain-containing protein [Planctomycetota bacterium]|nr:carboxypeptidase-like regulatory domain-containing protein [Planctomycetota bacterium]